MLLNAACSFFTFVSLNSPFCFPFPTLNVSQDNNRIGDDGARAIADAMRVNSSVQTLNLVRLCCCMLLDVFFTFVSLKFLLLFQYLNLNVSQWTNNIGSDGARAIADAMRVNSSVQTLDLVRFCVAECCLTFV